MEKYLFENRSHNDFKYYILTNYLRQLMFNKRVMIKHVKFLIIQSQIVLNRMIRFSC